MIRPCLIHAALAFALLSGPAAAQEVVQPLPGTTDADRLGEEMRRVGANPRDTDALLTAGELSLKLGDLSGAASLFARAEKVDPRSGRLKAGMAAILVRSERPGEALRYFAQAEALGYDLRRFAADRAFAFDLIGEQQRAQRDYRTALADRPGDEETVRRYALSLGISGRQGEALAALDPLLRRNDRGAWRARAFVLAMGGDVADAARIARTMMPPGMASGLQPFFERLPTLPAADRAFAVHFGEVRATPERIADARLIPTLNTFVPDAPVRTVLASAQPAESGRDRRKREQRERRDRRSGRGQVASAAVVVPPVAVQVAALPAPSPATGNRGPERVAALSRSTVTPVSVPSIDSARATPTTLVARPAVASIAPAPSIAATRASDTAPPAASPVAVVSLAPDVPGPAAVSAPVAQAPVVVTPTAGVPAADGAPAQVASVAAPAGPPALPASVPEAPAPGFASLATAPASGSDIPRKAAPARIAGRTAADSILARIVAGLSIPAAELGVVAPERPVPAPRATALAGAGERVVQLADAKEARDAAARRIVVDAAPAARPSRAEQRAAARRPVAVDADKAAPPLTRAQRAAARKLAAADAAPGADETPPLTRAEKRAAARRQADEALTDAAADRGKGGTAADRKRDDDKRADTRRADKKLDDKKLADKKLADRKIDGRAERDQQPRIWVQVAGGANEGDLPKAWASVKGKAAGALGKRQAYTTPLRATNRVLTGPFKTDAEARAFVNTLAKSGVSAFTFTSDAGQRVKPLSAK